MELSRV